MFSNLPRWTGKQANSYQETSHSRTADVLSCTGTGGSPLWRANKSTFACRIPATSSLTALGTTQFSVTSLYFILRQQFPTGTSGQLDPGTQSFHTSAKWDSETLPLSGKRGIDGVIRTWLPPCLYIMKTQKKKKIKPQSLFACTWLLSFFTRPIKFQSFLVLLLR